MRSVDCDHSGDCNYLILVHQCIIDNFFFKNGDIYSALHIDKTPISFLSSSICFLGPGGLHILYAVT